MTDDTEHPSRNEEDQIKRRKRIRTLILGTLAASGAFQLNGWQAQAHGNRSSHSTTALRSDLFLPQDYVTFRQQLTAPDAEQTMVLSRLTGKMQDLQRAPGISAAKTTEMGTLQREIDSITDKLRLRETSRQTLDFIQQGDIDAAAAVIEGEGEPERVTYEYLWTITDLAYLGRKDNRLSNEPIEPLTALSRRAIRYVDGARDKIAKQGQTDLERGVLTRIAEIYHNVASYMVPDIGKPTPEGLKLGYDAAVKAHALRVELKQPAESLIALWTVANYEGLQGNTGKAKRMHREAIAQAEAQNNPVQVAWNKFSLAKLQGVKSFKQQGNRAQGEIEALLSKAAPDDPVAALLRLEIESMGRGG